LSSSSVFSPSKHAGLLSSISLFLVTFLLIYHHHHCNHSLILIRVLKMYLR
jgi:hypothetical protein